MKTQEATIGARRSDEADDRLIATGLRLLRQPAPQGLSDGVLSAVGLAHEYVKIDGPIGPLFVAYGKHGISFVERADTIGEAGDFEEAFRATFGRPVHRVEKAPKLIETVINARLYGSGGKSNKVPVEFEPAARFRAPGVAQGARDPPRRGSSLRLGSG